MVSDLRRAPCYAKFERGRCTNELLGLFMKPVCCCSIGQAWGDSCEACPHKESGTWININAYIHISKYVEVF